MYFGKWFDDDRTCYDCGLTFKAPELRLTVSDKLPIDFIHLFSIPVDVYLVADFTLDRFNRYCTCFPKYPPYSYNMTLNEQKDIITLLKQTNCPISTLSDETSRFIQVRTKDSNITNSIIRKPDFTGIVGTKNNLIDYCKKYNSSCLVIKNNSYLFYSV